MEHASKKQPPQGRVLQRKLGNDRMLYVLWFLRPILRIQDEQDVSVRQSSLLELDDVTMGNILSHDPVLVKIIQQPTQVALEHTRRKIRSIFWPFSGQEILRDFLEATTQSQIVTKG
jgi:hypothetical protein